MQRGWEVSRIFDRFDEIFELAEANNWFAAMQRSRDAYHQIRRAARTAVQISTQIQSDLQTRALYAGALTSLNKEPAIASAAAPMINNEWNSLIFERLGHATSLLGVTQRLIVSEQAAIAATFVGSSASAQDRVELSSVSELVNFCGVVIRHEKTSKSLSEARDFYIRGTGLL